MSDVEVSSIIPWLTVGVLAGPTAGLLMQEYMKDNNLIFPVIALGLYALLLYSYIKLLPRMNIAYLYPCLHALAIIYLVLISIFFLNIKIDRLDAVAILLIIVCIIILGRHVSA